MYFKQLLNEECGCSSYIIASRQSKEAAVVDPALAIQPYLDLARERGFRIKYIIDTHLHADHISGNRKLAEATGAELCLHESANVLFPFRGLRDGEEVPLGQLRLRVVHTPGHRPEAISLVVTNPPRSPEPSLVLSGDTLFVGDVGRPDFGGPEGARQQYQSVRKLLRWPTMWRSFLPTSRARAARACVAGRARRLASSGASTRSCSYPKTPSSKWLRRSPPARST